MISVFFYFFTSLCGQLNFTEFQALIWHQERCAHGLQAPGESLQDENFHHNPASIGETWPCGARQPAGGFASLHQAHRHRGEWDPTDEPRRNSIYSTLVTSCVCLQCCRGCNGLGFSSIFRFSGGFAVFASGCVFPCPAFALHVYLRLHVQSGSANNGYYIR